MYKRFKFLAATAPVQAAQKGGEADSDARNISKRKIRGTIKSFNFQRFPSCFECMCIRRCVSVITFFLCSMRCQHYFLKKFFYKDEIKAQLSNKIGNAQ